jgi:hypothetical protein
MYNYIYIYISFIHLFLGEPTIFWSTSQPQPSHLPPGVPSACTAFQVSHVALGRAQLQRSQAPGGAQGRLQGAHLHGVPQGGAGAVGLQAWGEWNLRCLPIKEELYMELYGILWIYMKSYGIMYNYIYIYYMELLDKHTCFQQAYSSQVELFVLVL